MYVVQIFIALPNKTGQIGYNQAQYLNTIQKRQAKSPKESKRPKTFPYHPDEQRLKPRLTLDNNQETNNT